MEQLKVGNWNIMSSNLSHYGFAAHSNEALENVWIYDHTYPYNGNYTTYNGEQAIQEIEAMRMYQVQAKLSSFIKRERPDVFSLEEVPITHEKSFDKLFFEFNYRSSLNVGSSGSKYIQAKDTYESRVKGRSYDVLKTYYNNEKITLLKDLSNTFQNYYTNLNASGHLDYPSRTQIILFKTNATQTPFIYIHVHGPGIPIDELKARYFHTIKNYIITEQFEFPILFIGDFNDDRHDQIRIWLTEDSPLNVLVDKEDPPISYTSFHKYVVLTNKGDTKNCSKKNIYRNNKKTFCIVAKDESETRKHVDHIAFTHNLNLFERTFYTFTGDIITSPYILFNSPELYEIPPVNISDTTYPFQLNKNTRRFITNFDHPSDHTLCLYQLSFGTLPKPKIKGRKHKRKKSKRKRKAKRKNKSKKKQ